MPVFSILNSYKLNATDGYNNVSISTSRTVKQGSILVVEFNSTGRLAVQNGQNLMYSDYYITNTRTLVKIDLLKNAGLYFKAIIDDIFHYKLISISRTYPISCVYNLNLSWSKPKSFIKIRRSLYITNYMIKIHNFMSIFWF